MEGTIERRDPVSLGWAPSTRAALSPWLDSIGPIAIVELRASGRPTSFAAGIREIALVLLDPSDDRVATVSLDCLLDPPSALARVLAGQTLVAFGAATPRAFLAREVAPELERSPFLDARSLFALCHPDAPDLELATLARVVLSRSSPGAGSHSTRRSRSGLDRALLVAELIATVARGAQAGEARYREVARILARRIPDSPWRSLVDRDVVATGPSSSMRWAQWGEAEPDDEDASRRWLAIGDSDEAPVPFELGAIEAALSDAERGARHFPGYRVRKEQIELARQFVHVLQDGGVAKLEGGTGVGKSLAYLAAVIPFAMARAQAGERAPVVLSTRTKLLQDQLLHKDIAAAARFLGHPDLRALSIKGRANYVCERRLAAVLADGGDPALARDWQRDFALLEACARIRPAGEVGTLPAALFAEQPRLRELLRASVAARADQCSREQCGHESRCPFGRHRRALARAQLVVANHDLLLRWPPDYPAFSRVVVDEGHELAAVAEDVYSLRVRPDELEERLEVLFGAPVRRGARRYATRGLVATPATKTESQLLERNREALRLELSGLGAAMASHADPWGASELPEDAGRLRPAAAKLAASAAMRLEALAQHALREGPERRFEASITAAGERVEGLRDLAAEEEIQRTIAVHVEALRAAALGLRRAFSVDDDEYVGAFEGLEAPYDRWSLILRPIDPSGAFREEFLGRVESLAVVSATLFVGGDDHAALGELGLAGDGDATSFRHSVPSPFPYAESMRVVALEGGGSLVEDTAAAIALLARRLGGRTLGLFTSLARMREVAERLATLLEGTGIELLVPLRAGEDPGGLIERLRRREGAAVVLGARRYWQGIDVRGDDLQAVVIEKLPFEVPTELSRRRDLRLRAAGHDPFERAALGHMLLHLKQMVGRLIRSETDRGLVVIVDARTDRGYFRRLGSALPDGVAVERAELSRLPSLADELGLGPPDQELDDLDAPGALAGT